MTRPRIPDADLGGNFTVPTGHTIVITADDDMLALWVTCSCGFETKMLPADSVRYVQRRLNQAHGWL